MNAFAKAIEQAAKRDPVVPLRQSSPPSQRQTSRRPLVQVEIAPGVFHRFSPETGELVGYQAGQRYRVTKRVGEDTVLPKMATHGDALADAMCVHDRWAHQCTYYAERVLDLLDSGIDGNAVRVLKWLCADVVGRNIWFGCTYFAQQKLGMSRPTLTRAIAALTNAGLVRVIQQGRGKPTRVDIHPWYVFKGDKQALEQYLSDWVREQVQAALQVPLDG